MSASFQNCRLIPALCTPFTADNQLDVLALATLVTTLVNTGCDAVLVNGTTGESPTLSGLEKRIAVETVVAAVGTRVPVLVGVGSNCTQASIEQAVEVASWPGVSGLLVVVPYYNKPTQAGIVAHFSAIAQAVAAVNAQCELILYNIPGRCGVQLHTAGMLQLHQCHPNIVGVKQSVPDMDAASEIAATFSKSFTQKSFTLWCGDDSLTLPMMACGAQGVISVLAHVAAPAMRQMIDAFAAGKLSEAQALHYQLLPLARGIFQLPNPTLIKALLQHQQPGFSARMRLPMLAPRTAEELAMVDALCASLALLPPC